MRSGNRPGQR